ncbi:hypothetical protein [Actinotalea sp. Marseille-Q4924]|uniref:hypothetical protein n=1 Tax=Actinotalea sp. Marseille-Q4924 TaxID=2866571 RepID=UPI001CE49828|nr:hypothetical protein [Actinotalea sp. Marseille-Q4924]
MSTATRLVVVTMTVGLLAGCAVGQDREPTAAPTSSPEVTAPTGEDAEGGAGTVAGEAEAETPTEEIAPDAPQQVADVVAALPAEPLPDIAPAAGTVVTSGTVSLTVPAQYRSAGAFDGVQLFAGPVIRGTRSATSGAQVYPPVTDAAWAQRLSESLSPALDGVTSTVYTLDVPGADAAVVHVVTDTEGHSSRDREGRRVWQAPVTTAHVLVGVGDQVTRIVLQTPPTPEGLDAALSVARTVAVAG